LINRHKQLDGCDDYQGHGQHWASSERFDWAISNWSGRQMLIRTDRCHQPRISVFLDCNCKISLHFRLIQGEKKLLFLFCGRSRQIELAKQSFLIIGCPVHERVIAQQRK
jgi:hypothetical protein